MQGTYITQEKVHPGGETSVVLQQICEYAVLTKLLSYNIKGMQLRGCTINNDLWVL